MKMVDPSDKYLIIKKQDPAITQKFSKHIPFQPGG